MNPGRVLQNHDVEEERIVNRTANVLSDARTKNTNDRYRAVHQGHILQEDFGKGSNKLILYRVSSSQNYVQESKILRH